MGPFRSAQPNNLFLGTSFYISQLQPSTERSKFAQSFTMAQAMSPQQPTSPSGGMSPYQGVSSHQNIVMPQSHVGFDSITSQIERKLLKRGFQFNVICVGKSFCSPSTMALQLNISRTNWTRQIYSDQHYLRIPLDGFKRSSFSRRGC